MARKDDTGKTVRPFAAVLQEINKGDLNAQLAIALNGLVLEVMDAQKLGTLTLTIKVEPTTKDGYSETVTVSGTISVKEPRQTQAAIFYATGEGNLQRNHPEQPQLPLQDVSAPHTPGTNPFSVAGDGA